LLQDAKKYPVSEWDPVLWYHSEIVPCLTKAIVETQSFDPNVLEKHLQTMTWDTPLGPFRFGGSKQFGIKTALVGPLTLLQVQNGKAVYLGGTIDSSRGFGLTCFHPETPDLGRSFQIETNYNHPLWAMLPFPFMARWFC